MPTHWHYMGEWVLPWPTSDAITGYLTWDVYKSCNKEGLSWFFGRKRFQATAFQNPPPGNLPVEHTASPVPVQVVCLDYASPISNKVSSKRETRKAYILLFAEVFIKSFKWFIARRGRPQKVYPADGRTFVTAVRRLRGITMDERMHDYLSRNHITWQFNLSRAPWWGGQFQRLAIVVLVKEAF